VIDLLKFGGHDAAHIDGTTGQGTNRRAEVGNESLTSRSSTLTTVTDLEKHLGSMKWRLWHCDVFHALQRIEDIEDNLAQWINIRQTRRSC
jgi:hypothetical protein